MMKKCTEDCDWVCVGCDGYGQATMKCYDCDQEPEWIVDIEMIDYGEGIRFKGTLWDAREHIDPPSVGFEMFADSCPDTNVTHLLNSGYDASDICIVRIGYDESVWLYRGDE
jgi:hypothetical protein